MSSSLKFAALQEAMSVVQPFLSWNQFTVMTEACHGEEEEFFMQTFVAWADKIKAMPATYQQDGLHLAAVVHLHYFFRGSDWYITEKDVDGGIQQAYGYAILNGDDQNAELGYISIEELTCIGAELDLHFLPCTLAEIKVNRSS